MASNAALAAKVDRQISLAAGLNSPASLTAHPVRQSILQFTRYSMQCKSHRVIPVPVENCYLLVLALNDNPAREIYHGGQHSLRTPMKRGRFSLLDCSVPTQVDMSSGFDNINMYLPKDALAALAVEHGQSRGGEINLDFLTSSDDLVVRSLGHCLLPAFERPEQASRLFLDQIAVSLAMHLTETYGGAGTPRIVRGGLAPRQVQRAKDVLMSRLDGETRLEDLARECGLSRSHFARAFKKTLGIPPHRWLMERRLERACELLLKSKLSLADIADACGFADQSHLTRCFAAAIGSVPSEWRRIRCS